MLKITKGKRINLGTDLKYGFGIVHTHEAIWEEKGLLSAQRSPVKYREEISHLQQSVQKPEKWLWCTVKPISLETLHLLHRIN